MLNKKMKIRIDKKMIDFIQSDQHNNQLQSHSEVIAIAVQKLYEGEVTRQYKAAMIEWYESGEAEVWESVIGDGITDDDFSKYFNEHVRKKEHDKDSKNK